MVIQLQAFHHTGTMSALVWQISMVTDECTRMWPFQLCLCPKIVVLQFKLHCAQYSEDDLKIAIYTTCFFFSSMDSIFHNCKLWGQRIFEINCASTPRVMGSGQPSGFGFELTFRLKCYKGEKTPPTWPAELMQSLARYVFQSENILCIGDHISWHSPLDRGDSCIQHMLLTQDPQLPDIDTELGFVKFVQVSSP